MKTRFQIGIPALAVVIWATAMSAVISTRGPAPYPLESRFYHDVSDPVLAIELSHGRWDIERVLPPANKQIEACRRAILVNTILDFVFIPLYVWYLIRLIRCIGNSGRLPKMASTFVLLAGLFDIAENFFILAALRSTYLPIYLPSLAKWAMLGLALVLIGHMLAGDHAVVYSIATDRLLGIAHVYAAGLMLLGVVAGEWLAYSWIQHGASVLAATFLVTGLYIPLFCIRRLLPPQLVRYVDDFCVRKQKGELVGRAVQPIA
jgi:hypothetical protein